MPQTQQWNKHLWRIWIRNAKSSFAVARAGSKRNTPTIRNSLSSIPRPSKPNPTRTCGHESKNFFFFLYLCSSDYHSVNQSRNERKNIQVLLLRFASRYVHDSQTQSDQSLTSCLILNCDSRLVSLTAATYRRSSSTAVQTCDRGPKLSTVRFLIRFFFSAFDVTLSHAVQKHLHKPQNSLRSSKRLSHQSLPLSINHFSFRLVFLFRWSTANASNFGPQGEFGPLFASFTAFLGEFCAKKKKNRTEFANRKLVYNFYSMRFFCRPRFDNRTPFWKKRAKVSVRSKVRGFEGTRNEQSRVCRAKRFLQPVIFFFLLQDAFWLWQALLGEKSSKFRWGSK